MRLAPLLSYGAVFWVAALAGAPLLASSASATTVVAGLAVYRAASIVCHQIPERSFWISALPVAVCARCFGLYLGASAAAIAFLAGLPRRSPAFISSYKPGTKAGRGSGVRLLLAIAAVPTAATWLLERSGWWAGSNAVRFVAAVPLGLAGAWIVLATVRAETADTID